MKDLEILRNSIWIRVFIQCWYYKWILNCYFLLKNIEETKTKPQETLEFKMIQSKQTFLFNPPTNLFEEGKCSLAVSSLEFTNSVLKTTNESISFSITLPGNWSSKSDEVNSFLTKQNMWFQISKQYWLTCARS